MAILELCIDTPAAIPIAAAGGADRIELCSALSLGGLTPSAGLVAAAVASGLPVLAMIRPVAGRFAYDAATVAVMGDEIGRMSALGVAGIVFGALMEDRLDVAVLTHLMAQVRGCDSARASPLQTTLHRAIDLCGDPLHAVDQAISLGFDRILTSGGAATAIDGVATLAAMQARAAGRCEIVAGAGISVANVRALLDATGVGAVHASCRGPSGSGATVASAFGFGEEVPVIDADRLAALRREMDRI